MDVSHRTHHQNHGHVENDESWHPLSEKVYKTLDKATQILRFTLPFPMLAYPFYLWSRSPGKSGSHFDPNSDLHWNGTFIVQHLRKVLVCLMCWLDNEDFHQALGGMPPLIEMLKKDVVWGENRVVPKYRQIIRDLIKLFAEWEFRRSKTFLDVQHINIINDRLDENQILCHHDRKPVRSCKAQFKVLVAKILDSENRRPIELTHFYEMASRDKVVFDNLLHHPLLMASHEREKLSTSAFRKLEDVKNWIEDYKSYEKSKYMGERKRNTNIRNSIKSSKYHMAFNSIYERNKDSYEDNVVGVLNYSRNITKHLGQHLTKTHEDLGVSKQNLSSTTSDHSLTQR
ncbi:hypothetical protein L3X38_014811 [Prunus dulcis]|uniref:Uncharacterized protein n=1 Tax=Prunus dulcis TaxID=3755 RepID=A0AAD4WR19_PRUDU|nr:hypothetical protein L3X38_014811 [Prunus dulcis]